jgi:hypothetical protein
MAFLDVSGKMDMSTLKKKLNIYVTLLKIELVFYINFKVLPFMITNVAWLRLNHTSPISYGQVSRSADEL